MSKQEFKIMKFKDIKDLICSECCVVIDKHRKYNVQTHEPTVYDELEVIGIRSKDNKWGSYIIVSLKDDGMITNVND